MVNEKVKEIREKMKYDLEHIEDHIPDELKAKRDHYTAMQKAAHDKKLAWETKNNCKVEDLNSLKWEYEIKQIEQKVSSASSRDEKKQLKALLKEKKAEAKRLGRLLLDYQNSGIQRELESVGRPLRMLLNEARQQYYNQQIAKTGNFSYENGIITFGSYDQGNGKKEPVRWIVVEDKYQGELTLLCEKAIEVVPDNLVNGFSIDVEEWIASKMFDELFTDEEKVFLIDDSSVYGCLQTPSFTNEKLLRSCAATKYAIEKGAVCGPNNSCSYMMKYPLTEKGMCTTMTTDTECFKLEKQGPKGLQKAVSLDAPRISDENKKYMKMEPLKGTAIRPCIILSMVTDTKAGIWK